MPRLFKYTVSRNFIHSSPTTTEGPLGANRLHLPRWLRGFSFETDNKALRQTVRQAVEGLQQTLAVKTACVESCREGFSDAAYCSALANAEIDFKQRMPTAAKPLDYRETELVHPELMAALQQWRADKADEEEAEGVTRHRILTRAVLRRIAEALPDTPQALVAVKGIGRSTAERYGEALLALVQDYCRRQGIDPAAGRDSLEPGKTGADRQPGDSRLISYRLYQEGLGIEAIAERRSLKASTIAGHLAHFIGTGQLPLADFVDAGKIERISAAFDELGSDSLGPVKERLGDDCSYAELAMVRAHLARD